MTPAPKKTLLSWSSGKDSAWSLHVLRRQHPDVEVVGLLTTVNERYERVAMHAVRRDLLRRQAESAGLPLWEIAIPSPCSNEQYEEAMGRAIARAREAGVERMAFGDLFLLDIRRYREERLAGTGIEPIFPLWGIPTDELARTMQAGGLRARITCVDPKQLDASFCGRDWDATLLAQLPPGVDPCGERGEFHSFAYAGPMFSRELAIRSGERLERDGFVFADLLADDGGAPSEGDASAALRRARGRVLRRRGSRPGRRGGAGLGRADARPQRGASWRHRGAGGGGGGGPGA
jgi:uncharacterized protein (TIGR00290 family)